MDEDIQGRFNKLKSALTGSRLSFKQEKGYYIQLQHHDDSPGVRFYFRGKYEVELVIDEKDGPSRNICDFVLFSNIDDAVMYAVLKESSYLANKARKERVII